MNHVLTKAFFNFFQIIGIFVFLSFFSTSIGLPYIYSSVIIKPCIVLIYLINTKNINIKNILKYLCFYIIVVFSGFLFVPLMLINKYKTQKI